MSKKVFIVLYFALNFVTLSSMQLSLDPDALRQQASISVTPSSQLEMEAMRVRSRDLSRLKRDAGRLSPTSPVSVVENVVLRFADYRCQHAGAIKKGELFTGDGNFEMKSPGSASSISSGQSEAARIAYNEVVDSLHNKVSDLAESAVYDRHIHLSFFTKTTERLSIK